MTGRHPRRRDYRPLRVVRDDTESLLAGLNEEMYGREVPSRRARIWPYKLFAFGVILTVFGCAGVVAWAIAKLMPR